VPLRPPSPPLQVQGRPELRERHLGVLQGLACSEAPAAQPAAWRALCGGDDGACVPGGGESAQQLFHRVRAAIDWLSEQHPGEAHVRCEAGRGSGCSCGARRC
jgi:broad specificity phosphatase PhoE